MAKPTEAEIIAWADERIRKEAFNRSAAVQIAIEAANWVAEQFDAPPASAVVNTAPMYKALHESRLALLAVNSGASVRAIALIDAVLNAVPEAPACKGLVLIEAEELQRIMRLIPAPIGDAP